jgi:hypothetical protein
MGWKMGSAEVYTMTVENDGFEINQRARWAIN